MNKALLTLSVILTLTFPSFAQERNALLKYEEAVIAYEDNDYEKCIRHLDEAEKISGRTTANILYLRIMVHQTVMENQGGILKTSFSQIEDLDRLCDQYISLFSQTKGMESRLHEIKKISNSLPKTKQAQDTQIAQYQDRQSSERDKLLKQKASLKKEIRSERIKMWTPIAIGAVVTGSGFGTRIWANEKFPDDKDKRTNIRLVGGSMIAAGTFTILLSAILAKKHTYTINQLNRNINSIDTELGTLSFDYLPDYNNSLGFYTQNIGIKLVLKK